MNTHEMISMLIDKVIERSNDNNLKWTSLLYYILTHPENEILGEFAVTYDLLDSNYTFCARFDDGIIIIFALKYPDENEQTFSIAIQPTPESKIREYAVWDDNHQKLIDLVNNISDSFNKQNTYQNFIDKIIQYDNSSGKKQNLLNYIDFAKLSSITDEYMLTRTQESTPLMQYIHEHINKQTDTG